MALNKKTSLTRKVILGLGIPAIFVPGLVLAAMLGWDWQQVVLDVGLKARVCMFSWVCPRETTVIYAVSGDSLQIVNGGIVKLAGIEVTKPDLAEEYLNLIIEDSPVRIKYDFWQNAEDGNLSGEVWMEEGGKSVGDLLVENGYAKKISPR